MDNPIIELSGLTKRYGSLTAVDKLDLRINTGEVFGLLGPNGAGKTTTILMMLGLSEPSAGKAQVCGYNASRYPIEVKRKVGYLPDRVGFYGNMTALENLVFIARLNGLDDQQARDRATELLDIVGLSEVVEKEVSTFSRGMKQRLGLADVLIKQPSVIILDEPTLGIDPKGVREFLELIKRLSREQKLTVLLSSHHLQQVQRVCDRVGIFVKGKLLVEGSIDNLAKELLNRDGHSTRIQLQAGTVLSEELKNKLAALDGVNTWAMEADTIQVQTEREQTAALVRFLVGQGLDIVGVQQRRYALDEIYEKYFEQPETDIPAKNNTKGFFNKTFFKK